MVSNRAKILHEVCGEPMLRMVYRAASDLSPESIIVVIGQDSDRVRQVLEGLPALYALQEPQLGTGHAVISAIQELRNRTGDVLVLSGDTPRIKTSTLKRVIEHHHHSGATTTILTTQPPDPFGYGRILRGPDGRVTGIVEEKDASPEQKKIREINAAFYCFDIPSLLDSLGKLSANNAQKEYYLTDVVEIQNAEGKRVEAVLHDDADELQGINNRQELSRISRYLWQEKCAALMAAGVTIMDPSQTYIDAHVMVERDAILHPQVYLEGRTHIGEGAVIRSGSRIRNSRIEKESQILDSSIVIDSEVGERTVVGPFANLREGAAVGSDCRIGNYVEVKTTTLGNHTTACHLSYLGDAVIGSGVTIGAGTITCNYDGCKKNVTIVEDDVVIGADSTLIAPVRIGKGATVAAGSCITEDVPAGSLGIARQRQTNKTGWKPGADRGRIRADAAGDCTSKNPNRVKGRIE